jgi:hypothetical protein
LAPTQACLLPMPGAGAAPKSEACARSKPVRDEPVPPPLQPVRAKAVTVATAIGVALVVLAVAFDWNWFRPRLEHFLAERSQRSVRIGDLRVSLSPSLDPTLRLRDVRIANAAWADDRPFIDAGELRATFLLSSLFDKRPVISHLVVIDADIDFERQADGLRNWRLFRPDDRGPTRIRLRSIEACVPGSASRTAGLGLDLQTAASPVEAAEAPWTTRVSFEGTFRDAPFSGEALTGPGADVPRHRTTVPVARARPLERRAPRGRRPGRRPLHARRHRRASDAADAVAVALEAVARQVPADLAADRDRRSADEGGRSDIDGRPGCEDRCDPSCRRRLV